MAARRRLGQHFLTDRSALRRIVRALDPVPGEPLLEIGPGRGALTAALLGSYDRVAAVELDERLVRLLAARFPEDRLLLVHADVLRVSFADVLEGLGAAGRRLTVAGNLPYEVSKPVVQKLIRERSHVDRAVLMFQREVAERLVARPGSRAYGPLSVLSSLAYDVERLFDLKPAAFRPPPRVMSTVTRWRRLADADLDDRTELRLRRVLAVAFARRRRTLRNNLRALIEDAAAVDRLLSACELDGGLRAEQVETAGFLRLADALGDPGEAPPLI